MITNYFPFYPIYSTFIKMTFKTILLCIGLALATPSIAQANDTLTLERFLKTQNVKAEKTKEGIFFVKNTEGVGAQPRAGDFVTIKYVGRLLNGKKFDESPENEPFTFQLGTRQVLLGWELSVPMFKVGSKFTVYLAPQFAFGGLGISDIVPPNTSVAYDIELLGISNAFQYNSQVRKMNNSDRQKIAQRIENQFLTDKINIQNYAAENKLKVERTKSGVSYAITKEGTGNNVKNGETVRLNFEGFLLSNKRFDATGGKPLSIRLGDGKLPEGLEEALQFFNRGSEGWVLIPSKMAYGSVGLEEGNVKIPANAVLVFKIQVADILAVTK